MKPLGFVLIVIALHLGVAAVAASRHALAGPSALPVFACDPAR